MGAVEAVKRGFEEAISQAPATLFLFLSYALGALVPPVGMVLLKGEHGLGLGLCFLATLWIIAQLLRALALGASVREAARKMRDLPRDGVLVSGLAAAPSALGYLFLGVFLDFLVSSYRWVALLAAGGAYVTTLINGSDWGFMTSAGFALALMVCMPLGLLSTLWLQTALARAVVREEGYLASLYGAAGTLWERPWPALLLVVLTGALGFSVELTLSLFTRFASVPGERAWAVLAFGQGVTGILAGFAWAVLEAARLDGLAALALDEAGLLPQPAGEGPPPSAPPDAPPTVPPEPLSGLPSPEPLA